MNAHESPVQAAASASVAAPTEAAAVRELTRKESAPSRWVGICFGALLISTAIVPWGMDGERVLWPWHMFDRFFAMYLKVLVAAAWTTGLATLIAGIFLRGVWRTAAYTLYGVFAFGSYLFVTRASSVVAIAFLPSVTPCVWIQALAVSALFVLLFSTRVGNGDKSVRILQCISALLILGVVIYGGIESIGSLQAISIPTVIALFAAAVASVACLLIARQSFSASESKALAVARGLLLASLLMMIAREIFAPLFLGRRPLSILLQLNDQIVLVSTAMIALEGLIAISIQRPRSIVAVSAAVTIGVFLTFVDWNRNVYAVPQPSNAVAAEVRRSGEWTQWCGALDRNMIWDEKGLPESFDSIAGKKTTDLKNIKWIVPLGTRVLGSPVISGGKVFIGGEIEDGKKEFGTLWCFQESDGKLLWRMMSPYVPALYNVHTYGTCSTPTVEGDRLYMLSHLGDVLCLSANGLAAGNLGPFTDEAQYFALGRKRMSATIAPDGSRVIQLSEGTPAALGPLDADIIWRFDLLQDANCWPFNALNGAVIIRGEHLYIPTCSAYSDLWFGEESARKSILAWKEQNNKKEAYDSPALIVLDKSTGKLLARDHTDIFERTFHGSHSSPAVGTVNGSELIFYGAGNGVCYAFDPQFTPGVDGKPGDLKLVWKFDCLNGRIEMAEVIASPVFYKNRVYVSIGNDLRNSGPLAGPGRLVCIDATQRGSITRTAKIWSFDDMRSTDTTVAIADGLLYTADAAGNFYCLDADTGKLYWREHISVPIWSSPLAADGKVFIGTHGHGLLVFAQSKEKKLLSQNMGDADIVASPAIANGVLYIASQRHLYAIESGKTGGLVQQETVKK